MNGKLRVAKDYVAVVRLLMTAVAVARNSRLLAVMHISDQLVS